MRCGEDVLESLFMANTLFRHLASGMGDNVSWTYIRNMTLVPKFTDTFVPVRLEEKGMVF